jgi:rubrerythrin
VTLAVEHDIAIAREALRLEHEAAARYVDHPAASSDPRLVAYWESLRRNEAGHQEQLEAWLRRHHEDPGAETAARSDLIAAALDGDAAGRHPLKLARDARGHSGDLTALHSDYEFEDEAVVIYGHFAYQAEDAELRDLFKELARSESGHRNGLRRVIRTVQEAGTPVVLFCPLCGWELDFGPVPAEGAEVKCRMCPGRFSLRLDERGDWALERLAP